MIYLYHKFIFSYYFTKEERKGKFILKIKKYWLDISFEKTDYLVKTLKSFNITTKKEIELFINYYNKKSPITIKTSIGELLSQIAIAITSTVIVFVNTKTGIVSYDILLKGIVSITIVVLPIIIMVAIYSFFKNEIFTSKTKLYELIEEELTYIYLNYDKYKYQLTNKNK